MSALLKILAAVLFLSGMNAWATPQVVRVDGSIFDSSGNPYTGSRDLQVKAYDAATSGTLLWTSSVYTSTVENGRFTINLDASSGSPNLAGALASASAASGIYLEIVYDSGAANGSMDTAVSVKPRIRARGTLFAVSAATADAIRNVSVSTAVPTSGQVLSFDGAKWAPSSSGGSDATKLAKAGDTMTGALSLNYAAVTPGRFLYVDASRVVTGSSSAVTDAEFGLLTGVTVGLAANLNGVNSNIQSQLNGKEATLTKGNLSASGALSVSGGVGAVIGTGATITIATAGASATGVLTSTDWNTFNGKQAALGFTPVNKAGDTLSGALQVGGAIRANVGQIYASQNVVSSGATIDFNTGNVQVVSSPGQAALTLNNMQDGASYTVIVTDTTARQYTFTNCTNSWFVPENETTNGKTVYAIIKVTVSSATHCYISWITGY